MLVGEWLQRKAWERMRDNTEPFEYYQEGLVGRGHRRVLSQELDDGISIELVRIRAGTFPMGSPPTEDDRWDDEVPHGVEIPRDFYLGKYQVTRGQFRAFVQDTGYRTEAETDGNGGWGYSPAARKIEGRRLGYNWRLVGFDQTDDHPAVNVTWRYAHRFCRWLAKRTEATIRLPTEEEWEYACRAGSRTKFSSGDDPESLAKVANIADATARTLFPEWTDGIKGEDGYVFTAPCGSFLANRFGIHDMHGNVWEWCQDWHVPYGQRGAATPASRTHRVMRGGGFGKRTPQLCSSARRVGGNPTSRDIDLGFRVSLHLDD